MKNQILPVFLLLVACGCVQATPRPSSSTPTPAYTPTPSVRSYSQTVARKVSTRIMVRANDNIEVRARGRVRVGPFIGEVGPEGANDGQELWGSSYSISRQFRHGSLLYSYTGDDEWHYCGKSCSFSLYPSSPSGYLEFEINDSDQGNNSGAFELDITVTGR